VEITWSEVGWGEFTDAWRAGRLRLALTGWIANYPDPDTFLRAAIWRVGTGWQHKEFDRLVEDARQVMKQGERMRMYQQADRILVEQSPVLPLFYGRRHLLVKPWVRRYPTSLGKLCWWKDVIIEPH
jgi:ABC-type oligopeptide transport system substrate-binding subunit